MNRLDIATEVVVIGGYSEGSDLLEPTRRALSEGPNAMFESAVDVSPNIADIIANPGDYKDMFTGKTIAMRSLATLLASDEYAELRSVAHGFIVDAPVEPVGISKIANGARRVAFQKENYEENPDYIPSILQGPNELRRHPIVNAKLPFIAARFSTIAAITGAPVGSFNGGLGYFEREEDEFRFQNAYNFSAVDFMKLHGYDAATFKGKHMAGVYQPDAFAAQLKNHIETRS